jgi:hypothetical protein
LTSVISSLRDSFCDRAEPVCPMPALSRTSSVVRAPSGPWSNVWFDAVEHVS